MDGRMQGLDPAIEHFGHAGDAGHFSHRNAGLRQCRGRATGGQQLHPGLVQALRQREQSGLVRDADQCPFDCYAHAGSPRCGMTQPWVERGEAAGAECIVVTALLDAWLRLKP